MDFYSFSFAASVLLLLSLPVHLRELGEAYKYLEFVFLGWYFITLYLVFSGIGKRVSRVVRVKPALIALAFCWCGAAWLYQYSITILCLARTPDMQPSLQCWSLLASQGCTIGLGLKFGDMFIPSRLATVSRADRLILLVKGTFVIVAIYELIAIYLATIDALFIKAFAWSTFTAVAVSLWVIGLKKEQA